MTKTIKGYFRRDNAWFNGISDSLALGPFTTICYLTRSLVALEYCLFKKIKKALCFRCRCIMNPQTKRSFCLGVFLVIVTLVVLYSYCNGNSVCYTFPLFSMDRDKLGKPEAEMLVIVQTKRPIGMGTLPKKHKGTNDETSRKLSEALTKPDKDVAQKNTPINHTGIEEKIHFHHNRTTFVKYLFGHVGQKENKTHSNETRDVTKHQLPPSDIVGKIAEEILRKANISKEEANRELIRVEKVDEFVDKENQTATKTDEVKKHLLPPSDIIGKVAEEILRKANISEEEANRELIRVEKVDEFVDREKEHQKRLNKSEHPLLERLKESKEAGGKKSEKKLVRVERVDLTDEEEELEEREPEKPVQTGFEDARSQDKTKSFRMGSTGTNEDSELAHARRFGKNTNNTLKSNTSTVEQKENHSNSSVKENEVAITPPPFFARFLNVTAQEREMVDFLNNYNDSNSVLDGQKSNVTLQGNGTEKEEQTMAQRIDMAFAHAHADKEVVREKKDHNDVHNTFEPLIAKLLNLTGERQATLGAQNVSDNLKGSFNLRNILGKITESNHGAETSLPDSTALLVKFLQEGSRHRLRMPKNDTAVHTDSGKSTIANLKNNKLKPASEGGINLKKTLLELANHIDMSMHHDDSKTSSDRQEGQSDLTMLKLLLNQSTFQDYSDFNLSHVLKEIAENSVKSLVKRDKDASELGTNSPQSDLKIFRPARDELETKKTVLSLNTERKPGTSIRGEGDLASGSGPINTTSIYMDLNKNNTSFSSGSGSGESGAEESEKSSDSEKRENINQTVKEKSEKKQQSKLGTNGILKFNEISCEVLDPKVLLYNRIFKTGSSTTESIITNSSSRMNYAYKIGTTEDWYDEGKSHPYPGLVIRKANKKLAKRPRMAFVAHFYFRRNLNLPQAHTYINQVRDPVRRLVSHYHYMRSNNRPAYRIEEFRATGELDETLEKCFRLQHKGCQNNVITRFFCGRHFYCRRGTAHALHKAQRNIKRYYATVGLLENYDVYLQILHKRLPKFFPQISTQDIGKFKYNPKYNFDDISDRLVADIKRANWADMKLYYFVKKRFWKQAKACGVGTQSS